MKFNCMFFFSFIFEFCWKRFQEARKGFRAALETPTVPHFTWPQNLPIQRYQAASMRENVPGGQAIFGEGIFKYGNSVYSIKDMHCQRLAFLWSPTEWSTICLKKKVFQKNVQTCCYVLISIPGVELLAPQAPLRPSLELKNTATNETLIQHFWRENAMKSDTSFISMFQTLFSRWESDFNLIAPLHTIYLLPQVLNESIQKNDFSKIIFVSLSAGIFEPESEFVEGIRFQGKSYFFSGVPKLTSKKVAKYILETFAIVRPCSKAKVTLSECPGCTSCDSCDFNAPQPFPSCQQRVLEGALGAPPCPQDFCRIMQFSGSFKGKNPILSKFWAQPPPGVKTWLGLQDQNPGFAPAYTEMSTVVPV